jgi:hypothetical protein
VSVVHLFYRLKFLNLHRVERKFLSSLLCLEHSKPSNNTSYSFIYSTKS